MMEIRKPTAVLERIQNVYQEYPPAFWVLMTGTFIDRFGTNLIFPFLAIYVVQRFDAKITQVGLIYTMIAVSSGLGNFLAGALADRFGRRFTLILGMICAATARVALGLANDFTIRAANLLPRRWQATGEFFKTEYFSLSSSSQP